MEIKKAKKGRPYLYEFSFRRKICQELLEGKITMVQITKKYQIRGAGTVYRWLKWYENEQKELLSSPGMETPSSNLPSQPAEETPKTGIEEELRLAKAKIATLETMIDIAEDQFKIEIRKKSGTKPSLE